MKEILNIFTPELSPIHKVDFSIAAQMEVVGVKAAGTVIPAGTVLKGDFLANPAANKAEIVTATGEAITGVLMHDVVLEDGQTATAQYSVGVMIEGVVYEDVMKKVSDWIVAADVTALHNLGIKIYGAKTIGLSR